MISRCRGEVPRYHEHAGNASGYTRMCPTGKDPPQLHMHTGQESFGVARTRDPRGEETAPVRSRCGPA